MVDVVCDCNNDDNDTFVGLTLTGFVFATVAVVVVDAVIVEMLLDASFVSCFTLALSMVARR